MANSMLFLLSLFIELISKDCLGHCWAITKEVCSDSDD